MLTDYFLLSIKNLRKRKLRSWLTIISIFIAIATIVILISLSLGLKEAVNEQFRLLGTDKFFIRARGRFGPPGTFTPVKLRIEDVEAIEKVNGVKTVSYIAVENARIEFDNEIKYFPVYGIPLDNLELFLETERIKVDEGSLWVKGDKGKIMIGYDFKYNKVFKREVKANDKIRINEKEFRVKAIMERIGSPQEDKIILLPYENFKELFNKTNIDIIYVQIKENEDIKEVSERVERRLLQFRNLNKKTKDFIILTPEELLRSFENILNIVTAFLFGIAAISLIVGGIGIANTMYTSVLERTKEIGVMKAIGARNSDILILFLIEAGFLGLVGGIIGVIIGSGVVKAIEYYTVNFLGTNLLKANLPFYLFIGCLIFAFAVGILFGLLPSRQASKLKPVEALRYE